MLPQQYYDLIARMHGYAAEYNLPTKKVVKTFLVFMSDIIIVI